MIITHADLEQARAQNTLQTVEWTVLTLHAQESGWVVVRRDRQPLPIPYPTYPDYGRLLTMSESNTRFVGIPRAPRVEPGGPRRSCPGVLGMRPGLSSVCPAVQVKQGKGDMMRCEDALWYWSQDVQGQPVDQARLKDARAHIGACKELCARVRGSSLDDALLATPEQRAGQTGLYEVLGRAAEAEGDAHARAWTRLKRQAGASKASQEVLDLERAMALAAWQSAANYYHDGLRVGNTACLSEGLEHIKHKRLEPTTQSRRFTTTDPRSRNSRVPGSSRKRHA
ncbi:MAG TPA: hypothetical protein VKT82_24460 [Ktedonobacterales bacterium]|nr:hypothetical protein [Ktedonobacterales bacterium]